MGQSTKSLARLKTWMGTHMEEEGINTSKVSYASTCVYQDKRTVPKITVVYIKKVEWSCSLITGFISRYVWIIKERNVRSQQAQTKISIEQITLENKSQVSQCYEKIS